MSKPIAVVAADGAKGRQAELAKRLRHRIWRACCLWLFFCGWPGVASAQGNASRAAQTWFVGGDDLVVRGKGGHPDFAQMFQLGAPWPTGYRNIDVFQMRPPWALRADKQEVRQTWDFLQQHRIKIAVTMGGVITEGCGIGIEGFDTERQHEVYPREMKKMGLPIDYMVVDEPVTFGHEYSGPNSCRYSLQDTARRVAISVRQVLKYYPNIRIVLIEVPQALKNGAPELLEFLHDWKAELGSYPAAVRFDMQWSTLWQNDTPGFVQMLLAQHIPWGVIWDAATPRATTGLQWVNSAKDCFRQFHALIRAAPDENVIQSWNPQPDRNLPESDPSSTTGYLKWFVTGARSAPAMPR